MQNVICTLWIHDIKHRLILIIIYEIVMENCKVPSDTIQESLNIDSALVSAGWAYIH